VFHYIRPQDIADIIIMSFLVYQLYSWFRNSKALQIGIGIGFLGILYVVTKNLGLFMTSWILQELGTVLFVLIIVIFQAEIRQALYRISLLRNLFGRQEGKQSLDLSDLTGSIFSLAAARTGALLVFQRREPLGEYLLHGTPLDSIVSGQLISTIFWNGTPLHDGALVITDNRITQASCHLPLSIRTDLPRHYGTRHRAGLGLTERSDAVVVIVSEERGEVSLAVSGVLERIATREELNARLNALLIPVMPEVVKVSWRQRLLRNMVPKIVTVVAVFASWLIITARQGEILTVTAPLKFHNLPEKLALIKSSPDEVEVQVKAYSRLFDPSKQADIIADINLARIREGVNSLAITSDDLHLPLGVVVAGISPSVVKVTAEKKARKMLRVQVKTVGRLPGRLRVKSILPVPEEIAVEGPVHLLEQLESVQTEVVNLAEAYQNPEMPVRVLQPAPQAAIMPPAEVRIRLVTSRR
jgi:diadenylate cyclase